MAITAGSAASGSDGVDVPQQIITEVLCSSASVPAQMTIMYSNPVLCVMLGWALRGERVGLVGGLGITVTLLGVVFVAQPPVIFGGHEWSHLRMAGMLSLTYSLMRSLAAGHQAPPACFWMRA